MPGPPLIFADIRLLQFFQGEGDFRRCRGRSSRVRIEYRNEKFFPVPINAIGWIRFKTNQLSKIQLVSGHDFL